MTRIGSDVLFPFNLSCMFFNLKYKPYFNFIGHCKLQTCLSKYSLIKMFEIDKQKILNILFTIVYWADLLNKKAKYINNQNLCRNMARFVKLYFRSK